MQIVVRFGAKSQIVQRGIGVGSLVVTDGVYHRSDHSSTVHNAVHCTQKKEFSFANIFRSFEDHKRS